MQFIFPIAICHSNLAQSLDWPASVKSFDTFRHQSGVIDRERPTQIGGVNSIKIVIHFLKIVSKVVHFGSVWFPICVLQEQMSIFFFCIINNLLQSLQTSVPPLLKIIGEMIASVHNDPLGVQSNKSINVSLQVIINSVIHKR